MGCACKNAKKTEALIVNANDKEIQKKGVKRILSWYGILLHPFCDILWSYF